MTLLNIGPGKNGTSSVHAFLGLHPEIEASDPKEPQMTYCHKEVDGHIDENYVPIWWAPDRSTFSFDRPDEYYT